MTDNDHFSHLTDDEIHDIGMYRCECGKAVYPTGLRHCDLDLAKRDLISRD